MSVMVPAAVLAAGQSLRMGRPKALLPYGPLGHVSFLQQIVGSMAAGGLSDILVIGRPDDRPLRDAVQALSTPARFIPNPHHDQGQSTSIVAAINAVDHPGVRGVLVLPVDMPLVRPETFEVLLRAAASHPSGIVRATCRGAHGHPVIFGRPFFDALRHADPSIGAKAVFRAHGDHVVDVEVPDEGVLQDVDTMEDYIALFGGLPPNGEP